jgi:hypothetical protein
MNILDLDPLRDPRCKAFTRRDPAWMAIMALRATKIVKKHPVAVIS